MNDKYVAFNFRCAECKSSIDSSLSGIGTNGSVMFDITSCTSCYKALTRDSTKDTKEMKDDKKVGR